MKNRTIISFRRAKRKKQIKEGFFDGRFAPKIHKSKKTYTRKVKHPKKD
jgi:hypothetical protein